MKDGNDNSLKGGCDKVKYHENKFTSNQYNTVYHKVCSRNDPLYYSH
jgi:hypothetical protein